MLFKFKLKQYNEDYYKIYERLRHIKFDRIPSFKWMKHALNINSGERILDAGCGMGHLLNYVCPRSATGFGIDMSDVPVAHATKTYPHFNFRKMDITHLEFENESFDKIISFNVIEHIKEQDTVMRELNRVLKNNGIIVMGTNIKDSLCWKLYQLCITDHTHEHEFTAAEFCDFVSHYFVVKESSVQSGVFRFDPPLVWLFHYVLKGDILISASKIS